MCSSSVLCPLCSVPSFGSIVALQQRLIKAANGPLACPLPQCEEQFLGLDKLTIHLFTHTSPMMMSEPKTAAATAPATTTTTMPGTVREEQTATTNNNSIKRKTKKPRQSTATKNNQKDAEQPMGSPTAASTAIPASCDICEFNFRNCELRDMHIRLVHENVVEEPASQTTPADQEPFKCHLCAKTFKMKGSLRVHLKVVHMLGLPYVNNAPKLNICDRIRHKESESMAAGVAATATTQPYALSGALSMLTQPPSDHANPSLLLSSSELASGVDANPKIWECDVCAKCFTTKYFLKKHKRLHTGEMPYTCEICARTFTFQQSYHKHLLYHSEIKPHVCGVCGRAFKELSTMHNHERIHTGEKPFKCEVCGKCFRQRVSFLVHTRIHTGVMPYKCELCQKSFRYKVSQRTHKCAPAQPQSPEQFIQALLDSNGAGEAAQSPASAEIAAINGAQNEALLSQTIDDIVVESCQKLGICAEPLDQLPQHPSPVPDMCDSFNGNCSPLQQLQRLRLYSPQLVGADTPMSTDGVHSNELFGRFLMDSS